MMEAKLLAERGSPYLMLEQKDSFFHSKLCTDITTNIQNVSVNFPGNEIHEQNDQNKISNGFFYKKADVSHRGDQSNLKEQVDVSRKSMDEKLCELQQKSNKMMQMIPMFQGMGGGGREMTKMLPDFNFGGMDENLMTAKLKIIRDLQDKISLLEENISKPNVCQQYLRNIEQEINLDFQNYQQETKENNSQISNSQQSNVTSNSNLDCSSVREPQIEPFFSKFLKKQTVDVPICVSIPKIIQIQIPVNIIKTKEYYIEQGNNDETKRRVGSKNKLRFSKSKSDSGEYRRSQESSIEYIINDFSRRFNYEEDYMKNVGPSNHYQIPQIVVNPPQTPSVEKDEFNLPLDSFQQNKSDFHEDKEKQYGMRRTDRSYMSSNSQVQKIRDEFWKKDMMQFNQQQLSKVKESENNLDESYDDNNGELDINSRDSKSSLKKELTELTEELIMAKAELDRKQDQLQILFKITKELEAKSAQQQAESFQLTQNYEEVICKNNELSLRLKRCQSELDKQLLNKKNLNNKNTDLQKYITHLLQERSNELNELIKVIEDKNQEIQQSSKINQQLQKLLKQKEHQFQQHIHSLEVQIAELKDGKQFYKRKLEDEGINLNIEQANIIRDLIQKKQNKHQQLQIVQKRYCQIVESLKTQKVSSEKFIEELKKENERLTKLTESDQNQIKIESSLMSLIKDYNCQLGKKEQQIDHLRKMTERANVLLQEATNSSQLEVNAINSIKSLLLAEKCDGKQESLHFIYITDRLIRHIKLYEYNLIREKQERVRVTKKLTELNLYVNKEIEQSEKKAQRLLSENNRYKKQNQQLTSELRKIVAKLNVFKSKVDQDSKLSAIHLQNEFLQLQNKKLSERYKKLKCYSEDLQQKMISSFEVPGNTFSQSFCQYLRQFIQKQKEQNYLTQMQFQKLVKKIKYQTAKSNKTKPTKITLASGVLSYCNKHSKALSKSILMPLPQIPVTGALLPNVITLDKLLVRKHWGNDNIKSYLVLKILDLCCELVRVNRKLFHLKPCQIQVSGLNGKIELVIHREFGSVIQEEDETNLLYRAPQVLLDFTQSEASYVWTAGIIIDQIFHQKLFYRKINEIKSRKDNYQVRDTTLKVKDLLVQMLHKNQKERPTLARVKEQFALL